MRSQFESPSLPRVADGHVHIDVRGGYHPDTIIARAGRPLRLTVTRHDSWPCAEHIVFPDFDIDAELPPHETVVIDLLPDEPGEYEFTCSAGRLNGVLLVEPKLAQGGAST
jgi:plastocyanin domain-containing protein